MIEIREPNPGDPSVVGRINAAPDSEPDAPILAERYGDPQACTHAAILVDDKALTVSCRYCKVNLEPWQAVIAMLHADAAWKNHYAWISRDAKQVLVSAILELARRKSISVAERAEARRVAWNGTVAALEAKLSELRKLLRERRLARRREREPA